MYGNKNVFRAMSFAKSASVDKSLFDVTGNLGVGSECIFDSCSPNPGLGIKEEDGMHSPVCFSCFAACSIWLLLLLFFLWLRRGSVTPMSCQSLHVCHARSYCCLSKD